MVSKYDVFYAVASKEEARIIDVVKSLGKNREDHQNIRKLVLELQEEGLVSLKKKVKILYTEKGKKLYRLIFFCIKNGMNYNLLFKPTMLNFLSKAARKEFFIRSDIKIHVETFSLYTLALAKYGLLLIVSRKPLKCRLLQHSFFTELFTYFGKKIKFYSPKQRSFLSNIKKELSKFKRIQGSSALIELEEKQEIRFIHTSLSLEGNPLTLPETQKLILSDVVPSKHKLIDIQEVTNYKKAVDLMIQNARKKKKLSLSLILQYHRFAMAHTHGAGEMRKHNVHIRGNPDFKTADWQTLNKRLEDLMEKYVQFEKENKDVGRIISFASFFHVEFQRIHPFNDGNSRTSRLLMLHILRSHDLPILDLPIGYFDLYLDLTKRSKERDDVSFKHLVEEIIFFNLKRINSLLI